MEPKITPVLVTLTSCAHTDDAEQETPVRLRCQGKLRAHGSGYMLKYLEVQTDDETGQPA